MSQARVEPGKDEKPPFTPGRSPDVGTSTVLTTAFFCHTCGWSERLGQRAQQPTPTPACLHPGVEGRREAGATDA